MLDQIYSHVPYLIVSYSVDDADMLCLCSGRTNERTAATSFGSEIYVLRVRPSDEVELCDVITFCPQPSSTMSDGC